MVGRAFEIHLVGDDLPREAREFLVVFLDLAAEDFEIRERVAAFAAGHVQHEEQHAAAGDVAQELMAEAAVFMRAFDQAGNVGDGAAAEAGKLDDADDRLQSGERIGGDFRFCGGEFS